VPNRSLVDPDMRRTLANLLQAVLDAVDPDTGGDIRPAAHSSTSFTGPCIPRSDISPIWNPEFFGNTMVTNGRTWPVLPVEPRRYRFRFLNGCNARFLIIKIVTDPVAPRPAPSALSFWQIGSEGGFLRAPVQREQLLTAPAERADVIVDFTSIPVGTELYLINESPDEPFSGETAGRDFKPANPKTTGQVMKLVVRPLTAPDTTVPPSQLTLPAFEPLSTASHTRRLSLNEAASARLPGVGPREVLLGTLDPGGTPIPLGWDDPITENPALGATEIWELHNPPTTPTPSTSTKSSSRSSNGSPPDRRPDHLSHGRAASRTP